MDAGKMTVSINKAINTQEAAVKEKHARTCILGTHREKGAQTFWAAVNRLPLSSNAVLCWKFCHVFHKLLRDGHPSVLKDSLRYKNELGDMCRMWGHLSDGYGQLCSIYLKLLNTKMEFHTKNPRFPGNLQMTDRQLDEAGENDVNNFFQLTVEIFDYMEWELNLFQTVFKSLDMSRSVSVTAAGQCRLSPLIQVILDCSHLYDYTVKLLFKLHSCLPIDTLQGHRDRFIEQFQKLKDLFYRSSNLQYFKRLLQIPQLPENPPNFLRASALSEHISPVVLIPSGNSPPDSETLVETEDLVGMDSSSHQSLPDNKFDDIFGSSLSNDPFNFSSQNGMSSDDKDRLIEQLFKEIAVLRDDLGNFKAESDRLVINLKGRIQELEAELAEQKHLRAQAVDENEFVRTELEDLKRRRQDTEKAQKSLTEIERKSIATEQRYTKLKEKYAELVQSHAELLRKNAEVTKQVTVAREALGDVEHSKKELEDSYQRVNEHTQRKAQDQMQQMDDLQAALESSKQELQLLKTNVETSKQVQEVEDCVLQGVLQEAERIIQESLSQLDEPLFTSSSVSTDFLIARTQAAVESTEKMEEAWKSYISKTSDVSFLLPPLVQFAHQMSDVILQGGQGRTCDKLSDSCRICGTESLGYLSNLRNKEVQSGADCSKVTAALKHIAEIAQELRPPALDIREEELGDLVEKEMAATAAAVETAVSRIEEMLNKSRTDDTGVKLQVNERILGSCTDLMQGIRALIMASKDLQKEIVQSGGGASSPKEFYARNSRWTEGLISASKAVGWGATVMVFSHYNLSPAFCYSDISRLLSHSVTPLSLSSVPCLIVSRHLIILLLSFTLSRLTCVASPSFYCLVHLHYTKSNSFSFLILYNPPSFGHYTLSHISIPFSASYFLHPLPFSRDAADLVLQGQGKFEDLIVCSHEIAASTAQLVAASKVKAEKDSANLTRLQQASRVVNQNAAGVVASTKSVKSQIEEKDTMDFSSMTLTQIKRQEMDSQVRVLELENQLQKEREKLGELRKKHYDLAGVSEGWGDTAE
ncbi:huntingtin-interacting protein 1 isoform X2 [Ascaphus truei]|uniref:huntingtin-interacting protein 1 isoform X2 n=1 Tax=Ascaphus truei TaxID=8439 RepID=UPI003F5A01BB